MEIVGPDGKKLETEPKTPEVKPEDVKAEAPVEKKSIECRFEKDGTANLHIDLMKLSYDRNGIFIVLGFLERFKDQCAVTVEQMAMERHAMNQKLTQEKNKGMFRNFINKITK